MKKSKMDYIDDDEQDDILKTAEEIAKRALVLSAMITFAYGSPADELISWLKKENLWDEVSPQELDILKKPMSKRNKINYTWKVENLVILLWCINKLETLPTLTDQCDTEQLKKVIVFPPFPTANFIASSVLRDNKEIYDEYEKIYQAHWKIRDAQLNKKRIPDNLDSGVVYERHYAFNWATGYMGQSWDEISTDT